MYLMMISLLLPIIIGNDRQSRDLLTPEKALLEYQKALEKIQEIESKHPHLRRRRLISDHAQAFGGALKSGGKWAAGLGTTGAITGASFGAHFGAAVGGGIGAASGLIFGLGKGYHESLAAIRVRRIQEDKQERNYTFHNDTACVYDHKDCDYPSREYTWYYSQELASECCIGPKQKNYFLSDGSVCDCAGGITVAAIDKQKCEKCKFKTAEPTIEEIETADRVNTDDEELNEGNGDENILQRTETSLELHRVGDDGKAKKYTKSQKKVKKIKKTQKIKNFKKKFKKD